MERQLHKEVLSLIELRNKSGTKPYQEYDTIDEARQASWRSGQALMGHYDFSGQRKQMFVPSPEIQDGIPCYLYTPEGLPDGAPILVYYHGGGMTVGSTLGYVDTVAKILADRIKCLVLSVDYRLAPEHKFPAQINDSVCAANWVKQNKRALGASENSKVGVGGDSAGGQLAASVCHEVSDLAFQILVYPHVLAKHDYSLPSFTENKDGPFLTLDVIKWFADMASEDKDGNNPRTATILRDRFDHLPPALFICAEYDPLRDESYEYSKKLTEAGVHNELFCAKGAAHAFFTFPGHYKECCKEPHDKVVDFIRRFGRN